MYIAIRISHTDSKGVILPVLTESIKLSSIGKRYAYVHLS